MTAPFFQHLELGRFEPFPEKQRDTTVEVLCIYKMLRVWYHSKSPNLNMADYDACHNCYHKKCENIPRDVLTRLKDRWNRTVHIVNLISCSSQI